MINSTKVKVFKILKRTKVEGPGVRFCIWVQGCSKHCKGCAAQNTWEHKNGELIDTNEIFSMIQAEKGLDGVTFLGGEPFEQAQALAILAKKIKDEGLSLLTFSGFYLEELRAKNDKHINELLRYTDLLIDGPFEEEKFDLSRPWVGSTNKRYIFLTDRYKPSDIKELKNGIEVRIDKKGVIFVNGMGDFKKIRSQLGLLEAKNSL